MSGQGHKLSQEQVLRQRLLPQQMRFVAMLEKTQAEMEEEVERELEENPALEKVDSPERYYPRMQSAPSDDDFRPVQADREPTLGEALESQLADQTELTDREQQVARYIIGALDPNGYLTRTLPQLADDITMDSDGRLQPSADELRHALDAIRSMDPAGVGASDLRDSLILQLTRRIATSHGTNDCRDARPVRPIPAKTETDALEILTHYFDLFTARNLRKLQSATGISPDRLRAVYELVGGLNPKPGAEYASDPTSAMAQSAVSPDFLVETDGERLTVSIPNSLPELQIEESFRVDDLEGPAGAFIREGRTRARSFIELLQRRQETLMRIARALVKIQAPFFLSGDDESRIQPMVLRNLADATGLELSVVSRAVAGKWLATPWGVYSLKSFFNHGATDGASTPAILAALKALVEAETTPLSDEALAAALAAQGHPIARRTVAKYRDRLAIPPARLRRKL